MEVRVLDNEHISDDIIIQSKYGKLMKLRVLDNDKITNPFKGKIVIVTSNPSSTKVPNTPTDTWMDDFNRHLQENFEELVIFGNTLNEKMTTSWGEREYNQWKDVENERAKMMYNQGPR